VKLWPVSVNVRSGRLSRVSHSTVYCPLYPFLAPISLFLVEISIRAVDYIDGGTYRSSAIVEGRAIREVPVSSMTPVLSRSAVESPKVIESRSTSQ
jgi:hypothetical protein